MVPVMMMIKWRMRKVWRLSRSKSKRKGEREREREREANYNTCIYSIARVKHNSVCSAWSPNNLEFLCVA